MMKRFQLAREEEEEVVDGNSAAATLLHEDFLQEFDYLVQHQQQSREDMFPPRVFEHDNETTQAGVFLISKQPPREVRTSKKKDKRVFSCILHRNTELTAAVITVHCRVVFADTLDPVPGEETFTSVSNGAGDVEFNELEVTTPSLKFEDREMCLEFTCGEHRVVSQKFYSYSNVGVLKRRKEVEVCALSTSNKKRFHVVGKTFFQSPRLQVVFRMQQHKNQWRTLSARNVEFYSETVLFFDAPITADIVSQLGGTPGSNRVYVQVTNDGRNFSNALEHTVYVPLQPSSPSLSFWRHQQQPDATGGDDFEEFQARL